MAKKLHKRTPIRFVTGETDMDITEAVYTGYIALLTIANASASSPLEDVEIEFDLALTSSGFAAGHTSETIIFAIARKVDGTNYRISAGADETALMTALSGTNAAGRSLRLRIGALAASEAVQIQIKMSSETADAAFPYVLSYRGVAPTLTEVAAV